jgi:hypothetical protein
MRPPLLELLARHPAVLNREDADREQVEGGRFHRRRDGPGVNGIRHRNARHEADGVNRGKKEGDVTC